MKYLAWLDDNGKVQVHLLDLDGSEGTTAAVAEAIEYSLKKLSLNGRRLVLNGQATDSGGGGVLDGLAKELKKLQLCVEEGYLVASCSIHCLQLQLSKPTKELIGEGGPDKRNAMQLLHCVYDLQKYIEWPQVVAMMDLSQEWVDNHLTDGYNPDADSSRGDREFAESFNKVRRFRSFEPMGKQRWRRCPACVLTRWQYVGAAAEYGFQCYLVLFKFSQLCINQCASNIKINKAASHFQSLLLDPLFYSDVCLLHSFHKGYFKQEMDWLMQSKDLTDECGFQSHQMVVRCYCTLWNATY